MRIISQYGCYDMPYEQTMLANIGTKIYADNLAVKELCVAEYSTEEKAEKAMEMCRNRYAWYEMRSCGMDTLFEIVRTQDSDKMLENLKTIADKNIFQFPADEEVE